MTFDGTVTIFLGSAVVVLLGLLLSRR